MSYSDKLRNPDPIPVGGYGEFVCGPILERVSRADKSYSVVQFQYIDDTGKATSSVIEIFLTKFGHIAKFFGLEEGDRVYLLRWDRFEYAIVGIQGQLFSKPKK